MQLSDAICSDIFPADSADQAGPQMGAEKKLRYLIQV
jgi:hypothetical protein